MDPEFDLFVFVQDSSKETHADMTEMPLPKSDWGFNALEMRWCELHWEENLSSNKYQQSFSNQSYICDYVYITKTHFFNKN